MVTNCYRGFKEKMRDVGRGLKSSPVRQTICSILGGPKCSPSSRVWALCGAPRYFWVWKMVKHICPWLKIQCCHWNCLHLSLARSSALLVSQFCPGGLSGELIYLRSSSEWGGGWWGVNLINVVSCLKFILVLYLDSFSASSSAELMPSFFNSSTRSPFWCIWSRMSQPPTNSPLKYTWGMVGQLEKSLTPVEGRRRWCQEWDK